MAMQTGKYTLKHPIKMIVGADAREEWLREVTVKPGLDAEDMMVTDAVEGDVRKAITLIAHVTGQPFHVMKKLRKVDLEALGELLDQEPEDGPPTGETASAT